MSPIAMGTLASLLAGLATGVGALPALIFRDVSDKVLNTMLGVGAVTFFNPILPLGMAFAAGAMLFVISDEIIPETHSKGKSRSATFGVMFGFVIMMALDNLLG